MDDTMTARYEVTAIWPDGSREIVGRRDDMSAANRLALAAMHEGACPATAVDTRPETPRPATDAERAALAGIMPKLARTME